MVLQAKANYDEHDINNANKYVFIEFLIMTADLKQSRHDQQPDTVYMY